jgi:hypothetical protein
VINMGIARTNARIRRLGLMIFPPNYYV